MINNIRNLFVIINFMFISYTLAQYHPCIRSLDNAVGQCIPLSKCHRVVKDYLQNAIRPQLCSNADEQIVCCPVDLPAGFVSRSSFSAKRISEEKCEKYSDLSFYNISDPQCGFMEPRIVMGKEVKINEFPHMAAIGWTNADTGELEWKCGGSVISEKFILTAAHCLSPVRMPPDTVRLGDHNLKSDKDQTVPEDYRIVKSFKHPDYIIRSKYNDIALLEVDRFITFTKSIRPACLWQKETLNFTQTIGTGWGLVEHGGDKSDVLLIIMLDIVGTEKCRELYGKTHGIPDGIIDSQLCAGGNGKTACQGDSGGPIQVTASAHKCIFHIIGITSFGSFCGYAPSVYTRVSSYIDWIESIVWA